MLRPFTSAVLSIRLPPRVDPDAAAAALGAALEADPPHGAQVRFTVHEGAPGWDAPATAPWLADALEAASQAEFGQPVGSMGEGGTIPFMAMLGHRFPDAQFMVTGVLGPGIERPRAERVPRPRDRSPGHRGGGPRARCPRPSLSPPPTSPAAPPRRGRTAGGTTRSGSSGCPRTRSTARTPRPPSTCSRRPPGTRSGCSCGTAPATATGPSGRSTRSSTTSTTRRARCGTARSPSCTRSRRPAPAPGCGWTTTRTGVSSSAAPCCWSCAGCATSSPTRLVGRIDRALRLAVEGEHGEADGRRIPDSYSNIALMQAYVEVEAGHRLDEPTWVAAGEDRARRAVARFDRHGAFDEFNSPTYHGIDLKALGLWRGHSSSAVLHRARHEGGGGAVGRRRPLVPRRAAAGGRPVHPRLRDGPRGVRRRRGPCGCGPRWAARTRRCRASSARSPTAWTSCSARWRRSSARWCPTRPADHLTSLHRRAGPAPAHLRRRRRRPRRHRPGSARTWRSAPSPAPSTSRGGTSSTPPPRTGAAPTAPPAGSGPGCRAPPTPPSSPAAWSSGGTTSPAASPASSTTGRSATPTRSPSPSRRRAASGANGVTIFTLQVR